MQATLENIANGIVESKNSSANTSNPAALAQLLTTLKINLIDRTNNLVSSTADYWYDVFRTYLISNIVDNNDLMRVLLIKVPDGKNSEVRALRLRSIALLFPSVDLASGEPYKEKYLIAVAAPLLDLADMMGKFLDSIIGTKNWTIANAAELYKDESFKVMIYAWGRFTRNDLFPKAINKPAV